MISADQLKSLQAFSEMRDDQRAAIGNHCEVDEYKKGDKLFTEGDEAHHLWHVMAGQVDLRFEMPDKRPTSEEMTVSFVEVKEKEPEAKTLGWSCFVPPHKMRLSAYCVTNTCRIVRIPKESLLQLFEKDPEMGYKFMSYMIRVVGYRFQQFRDQVATHMCVDLMSGL